MNTQIIEKLSLDTIKNDSFIPYLTHKEALYYVNNIVIPERRINVCDKLIYLTINYSFDEDFSTKCGAVIDEKSIFRLSLLYKDDIRKIKCHILWVQVNTLIALINEGRIDADDIMSYY
jgi:hypothetical protein